MLGAHPSKSPAFCQEDLCHQDTEFLCNQLKVLATESNKYRAKTDRRRQRSIFRDILRFIEVPEPGAALLCPVCLLPSCLMIPLWRARGHTGLVPRLLLMPLSLLRLESTRRRPSDLAWSACTSTAGHASAPTKPLRRCWALASITTCRYGLGRAPGSAGLVLVGVDRPLLSQNNELLREIFGLGPPLVLDAAALKASKVSRFEKVGAASHICVHSPLLCHRGLQLSVVGAAGKVGRGASSTLISPSLPLQHLYNSAAFKARTKARSRVRDKRADVL